MNRIERIENSVIDHCITEAAGSSSSSTSTQPPPGVSGAAGAPDASSSYSGDVKHIMNELPLSRLITELAHEWDDAVEALTREKVVHLY